MDVPNENYVPDAAQQPSQLSQVPLLPVSTSEVPILDPLPYLTTAPVSPQQDSQTTVPLFNINSVPANQPIHFSDGVLLASELQTESQPSTSNPLDQEIAIPDNLLEVYNHLGILGKLLTSGSIATMKFLQAVRLLGDSFAEALGVGRPKYEYEINAYEQMKAEAESEQKEIDEQYATWNNPNVASPVTDINTTASPAAITVNIDSPPPPLPTAPVQYPQ